MRWASSGRPDPARFNRTGVRLELVPHLELRERRLASTAQEFVWNPIIEFVVVVALNASTPLGFV
jgi:hypothetical protein